jgi:hypothetical protein
MTTTDNTPNPERKLPEIVLLDAGVSTSLVFMAMDSPRPIMYLIDAGVDPALVRKAFAL